MSIFCGLVGLPNSGKSTLFNALTAAGVAAESYPFCTIEENTGIVAVPDARLARVAELAGCSRMVPTTIKFVDIAGLVEGASRGEGLGNRFLAKIREADLLVHVLRAFEAEDVSHVCGNPDPQRDLELVEVELVLADLATVENRQQKITRQQKTGEKRYLQEAQFLTRLHDHLAEGQKAASLELRSEEKTIMEELQLLTAKLKVIALNIGEKQNHITTAQSIAKREKAPVIPVYARLEAELAELPEEDRSEFLREYGFFESALYRLIKKCYQQLGMVTFFTVKGEEARAWAVKDGTRAAEAAGKVHSDMQRGFIAAETISAGELLDLGSVADARKAGLFRLEGKDYEVKDGDVIYFRFNV